MTSIEKERLVSVFYILLRDHLPAGHVHRIMEEHVLRRGRALYSCPHLAALAESLASKIEE